MDTAERLLREARDALEPGTRLGPSHMTTLEGRVAWLNRTRPLREEIDAYLSSIESKERNPPAPTVQSELPEEAKININGQWFYRGNRSPRWLACASRSDGSMSGISDDVETFVWPILEEIVRLRSLLAQREETEKEMIDCPIHGVMEGMICPRC